MVSETPPPSSTSVGDLEFSPRRLGRLCPAADTRCVVRQRFLPEGVLKPPQRDRLRRTRENLLLSSLSRQRGQDLQKDLQKEKCSDSGTSRNQFTASGHVSVSGAARVRHVGPFTVDGGDGNVSEPRSGAGRQDRGETANQHSSWTGDQSRRNSRTFIVTSARSTCSVRGGPLQ